MRGGLHRAVEQRLVDVAQAHTEFGQGFENLRFDPATVTHFEDEWIVRESILKLPDVVAVFWFVLERPWKLNQQRAQSAAINQGLNSFFEQLFVGHGRIPLMCESVPEFRCK